MSDQGGMSSHSDTDSDNEESPLASAINETHHHGSSPATPTTTPTTASPASATPSRALAEYANGTFNPLKPLLLYASKMTDYSTQPKQRKQRGGTRCWK